MITRVIISDILNGLAGLKDLLRDVFNARTIDLLERGFHIEIIFHDVHDRSASEVEHYSLVVVYLLGSLGNSESLSRSEGLSIIEGRFVEGVLKGLSEDFGVILLMWCVIVGKTIKCVNAHKTARTLRGIRPICAVLQA